MPISETSQFSPFRYKAFAMIWSTALVSNVGTQFQQVGAGWMMTSLTNSHDMVALVQAAATLPLMLFALLAGALADNIDRRSIMLTAQGFMLCAACLLSVLAWADLLTPWSLLGLTFLLGCGQAMHNPSWQASVGDLVPRKEIPQAVLLNSIGFNMTRSFGPALGGLIVAAAGVASAFALNALSFLVMLGGLLSWHPEPRKSTLPREDIGRALMDGISYVGMSPHLLRVLLRGFIFGVAGISLLALMPVMARDVLDVGALSYGLMLGFFGIGAILGGVVNARFLSAMDTETRIRIGFIGFALSLLWLAASRNLWLSAPALALAGGCWVLNMSLFNVVVQMSAPRWVVGRAISLFQTAVFGGMALGSWIWGALSDSVGIQWSLAFSGVAMIGGGLIGLLRPMPDPAREDLDPLDRFREPELQLGLEARSGPIAIKVEYIIRHEDIDEFLSLMSQRRRIRLRDGAHRWALLRDLEQPNIWTESYRVATWTEYLRHNMRRTKADADGIDRIRLLHQGEAPPRARRMIERPTVPRHDPLPLRPGPEVPH
ncbi:MFS transporter [Pseudoruegeria sp. SK021]|uniref:MFS transporter n=1 Tax=Pseudoruegeria sp. SK021 TaxID=1933035 RepID=UPI000A21BCBA|nr:MFS transporter [Pseudoruegeria sp. SK021]OSP55517.1 MFS transporter [Pseudoruegeria sp. SK021]